MRSSGHFVIFIGIIYSSLTLGAGDYQIPLPTGGFRMGTKEEYYQFLQQQQGIQQRQRVQNQIRQQLQQLSGGGGGGGGGSGGGGGGQKSSSNSNQMKPLSPSDFGTLPDFSKGNQELAKLVAQASQPDAESQRLLEELRKQLETSSLKSAKEISKTQIPDFSSMIRDTLALIQAMTPSLGTRDQLLSNARLNDKRRVVFRGPLKAPSDRGLVVGRSAPQRILSTVWAGVARPSRALSSFSEPSVRAQYRSQIHQR